MNDRVDEVLYQAMATAADVAPDSPDLPLVPARSGRPSVWVGVAAFAVTLVVVGIVGVWWSTDGAQPGGGPSTEVPFGTAATAPSDAESLRTSGDDLDPFDGSRLVLLGAEQEPVAWKLSAYVDGDLACFSVSRFALNPASPEGTRGNGCTSMEKWSIPGVLVYSSEEVSVLNQPPADHPLGDAVYGLVDESVATVAVGFEGGSEVTMQTFGRQSGLPIRGFMYNFLTHDLGAPAYIYAYDAAGDLLGSYAITDQ